ncbi:hypothetical protein L1987_16417 [Smallanthus sonchifolius]|uniref:Uncharacterized protein n=1 Tax=Smallanthus sonchifolius TaxID=185202 RepID=A0ACB9J8A4_9ASTR|nr:hypothetical protein L1987_16417 [Smallanthus sonchifolius]
MYLASLINKGREVYSRGTTDPTALPAESVLKMATVNGAKAVLWENDIGSLEVGKKADMIVINPSSWSMVPIHDWSYTSPKVVSVPVHFISSERPQKTLPAPKESAALKIQRVFRGFLVRKSVKKISAIRNEVCEVEMSINDTGIVDLIRVDSKERLRVNETLMSLLFKLDSIRGIDFGVRDFRKAVINKAIALQEKVDSIVAAKNRSAKITSVQVPESSLFRDQVVDGVIDATIDVNCNSVEVVDETEGERTDDKKRNIELLEKLMDDNEKMMTLMSQMFERNEMQTRMLNSLSQRVEQLEKAFACDKPRKKKRHSA